MEGESTGRSHSNQNAIVYVTSIISWRNTLDFCSLWELNPFTRSYSSLWCTSSPKSRGCLIYGTFWPTKQIPEGFISFVGYLPLWSYRFLALSLVRCAWSFPVVSFLSLDPREGPSSFLCQFEHCCFRRLLCRWNPYLLSSWCCFCFRGVCCRRKQQSPQKIENECQISYGGHILVLETRRPHLPQTFHSSYLHDCLFEYRFCDFVTLLGMSVCILPIKLSKVSEFIVDGATDSAARHLRLGSLWLSCVRNARELSAS